MRTIQAKENKISRSEVTFLYNKLNDKINFQNAEKEKYLINSQRVQESCNSKFVILSKCKCPSVSRSREGRLFQLPVVVQVTGLALTHAFKTQTIFAHGDRFSP